MATEGSGSEDNTALASKSACAERDALLDIVGIFAHDLSNPLQSITVLCELGMDDAPPGSEDRQRAEQCLEAADRMRSLIHSFAGLLRSSTAANPFAKVVQRVTTLFARRFERHRIEASVDIGDLADVRGVAGIEFALLNLLLGTVAAASDSPLQRYTLELHGQAGSAGSDHAMTLAFRGADTAGAWTSVPIPEVHTERAANSLAGARGRLESEAGGVRLLFPSAS